MLVYAVQSNLQESLHWEQMVLQQAAHYQVVPLVLINLKGCPPTAQTQQLVQGIKVGVADTAKARCQTGSETALEGVSNAYCRGIGWGHLVPV